MLLSTWRTAAMFYCLSNRAARWREDWEGAGKGDQYGASAPAIATNSYLDGHFKYSHSFMYLTSFLFEYQICLVNLLMSLRADPPLLVSYDMSQLSQQLSISRVVIIFTLC